MTSIMPVERQQKRNNLLFNISVAALTTGAGCGIGYYCGCKKENELKDSFEKSDEARVYALNQKYHEEYVKNVDELRAKQNQISNELVKLYDERFGWLKSEGKLKDYVNMLEGRYKDLVRRYNQKMLVEMPNCIMVYGKDKEFADSLLRWFGEDVDNCFTVVERGMGIVTPLDSHMASNNGKWQTLYIKDFATRINPKKSSFETIDSMKDIMSAVVDDYHTTIIFYVENPKELDEIALQSHRVVESFCTEDLPEYARKKLMSVFEGGRKIKNLSLQNKKYEDEINALEQKVAQKENYVFKNLNKKGMLKGAGFGLVAGVLCIGLKKFIQCKRSKNDITSDEL